MFERFTDRARRATVLAKGQAHTLSHNWIGDQHLLLGLLEEGEGVAGLVLDGYGLTVEDLRTECGPPDTDKRVAGQVFPFNCDAKKTIEVSNREALLLGHNYIGTEHLLLALVRNASETTTNCFASRGISLADVRLKVIQRLSGYEPKPVAASAPLNAVHESVRASYRHITDLLLHEEAQIATYQKGLDSARERVATWTRQQSELEAFAAQNGFDPNQPEGKP
jgi:ATP-dependent Clp protease ATP-binding subunit ClpC